MAVAGVNLTIEKGTDFSIALKLKTDGSAIGLSGYGVSSVMRKHYDAVVGYGFSAIVLEPSTSGVVRFEMHSTLTSQIKPGRYVYDVLLTDTNGRISKVSEGNVLVKGTAS
jgi:hypothetical protein